MTETAESTLQIYQKEYKIYTFAKSPCKGAQVLPVSLPFQGLFFFCHCLQLAGYYQSSHTMLL